MKRCVAWPDSALSCSFRTDELNASTLPCCGFGCGEELLLFGRLYLEAELYFETDRRRGGGGAFRNGGVSRGGFFSDFPSVQRPFQPGALQRLAASPCFSPLAVPCPRPVETTSPLTFSTKHLHPPYRHRLALQRTIAHPSTCRGTPKPLPVLVEAFNFKREELLLQYLKV